MTIFNKKVSVSKSEYLGVLKRGLREESLNGVLVNFYLESEAWCC